MLKDVLSKIKPEFIVVAISTFALVIKPYDVYSWIDTILGKLVALLLIIFIANRNIICGLLMVIIFLLASLKIPFEGFESGSSDTSKSCSESDEKDDSDDSTQGIDVISSSELVRPKPSNDQPIVPRLAGGPVSASTKESFTSSSSDF